MQTEFDLDALTADAYTVGGIIDMNYERCIVETTDTIKNQYCGGLPKHSFLLARSETLADGDDSMLKPHVILMRVMGPAELPSKDQLTQARHQDMEERIVESVIDDATAYELDPITKNEMEKTAVEAELLGTFYRDDGTVRYGNDIHTTFPSGAYMVTKPHGAALERIVNYSQNPSGSPPIDFGRVKYAATNLRTDTMPPASVKLDAHDLVGENEGQKTAVLGMTRTGKSNSMKLVATSVLLGDQAVGQLMFDPSGEYANATSQDDVALGRMHAYTDKVSADEIKVFKYRPAATDDAESLGTNLLAHDNVRTAASEAQKVIERRSDNSVPDYASNFIEAARTISPPGEIPNDEHALLTRNSKKQGAFTAALLAAGLQPANATDWNCEFATNGGMRDIVATHSELQLGADTIRRDGDVVGFLNDKGRVNIVDTDAMITFWETIAVERLDRNSGFELSADDVDDILDIIEPRTGGSGINKLNQLSRVHNADGDVPVGDRVYDRLQRGQLVIIDTSHGDSRVINHYTDELVSHVQKTSKTRFRNAATETYPTVAAAEAAGRGEASVLPRIQIYLEEAHRNFSEDSWDADGDDDTYVSLAKEGAKFQIGVVYATQEISAVEDQVLKNTANWIVTHFNSRNEVNELCEYYDFNSFKRKTRRVDDPGFARLRTKSSDFAVPTQIREFTTDYVESLTSGDD